MKLEMTDLSNYDRFEILCQMTTGLHALVFGVASGKDPKVALKALEDDGEIHEYVHAMIRLLPPTTSSNED